MEAIDCGEPCLSSFYIELENVILENEDGDKTIIKELIINSSWPGSLAG